MSLFAKLTKKCIKCGKKYSELVQVTTITNECTKTMLKPKEKCIRPLSQKQSNSSTEPKMYWKIINRFVSNHL